MRTKLAKTPLRAVALAIWVAVLLGSPQGALGQDSVYSSGLFQLDPTIPGSADILGNPGEFSDFGPDWEDLFNADRSPRDQVDAAGQPTPNGVPDYIDLYGGQWAVFTADDVLSDSTFVVSGSETLIYSGRSMAAEHDLGNAYVYSTFDSFGNLVLYAGVERLGPGDSTLEVEVNQDHRRLGHGPPWRLTGARQPDDLLVRISFAGGLIDSVEVKKWGADWTPVDTIFGETCNPAETICADCNGLEIDGGPWTNFDSEGDAEQITPGRFVELGVNVGALIGTQPTYTTVQLRTPQDIALSYFAEGN